MRLSWATVLEITEASQELQKLRASVVHQLASNEISECNALNYLALSAPVKKGDRVLLNMTALDFKLGTGGFAFVVPSGEFYQQRDETYGHIMKLRYTPLQREVATIEEQGSPYHSIMQQAHSLNGMPVVCCALASQVPLVAAAIKTKRPDARIVFCMTDEAALLYSFSAIFARAQDVGLIDEAITCGQSFGGTREATTLHAALLAAQHVLAADVCIVSIGPGTPGSDTPFGHGGIAQGESLNAVTSLGGLPIASLRLSFADSRKRHQGVSHHSLTVLQRICLSRALVPVPSNLTPSQAAKVISALESAQLYERHDIVEVALDSASIDMRGLQVSTMGRGFDDDPAFFSAAFAAGFVAAANIIEAST